MKKEQQNNPKTTLHLIKGIYTEAKGSELKEDLFKKMNQEVRVLSKRLRVTKKHAVLVAVIYVLGMEDDLVSFRMIMRHLGVKPVDMPDAVQDLEFLAGKEYLIKKMERTPRVLKSYNNYQIAGWLADHIVQNKAVKVKKKKIKDIIDLMNEINRLVSKRIDDEISAGQFYEKISGLIKEHAGFLLIKNIKAYKLETVEIYLLLLVIWEHLAGFRHRDGEEMLEHIFEEKSEKVRFIQSLYSAQNNLLKNQLVFLKEQFFPKHSFRIKLSDKMRHIIEESGLRLQFPKKQDEHLKKENKDYHNLSPGDIVKRRLIFDENGMKQLFFLKDILKERKLKQIQKRLTEKKFSKGITVLLHGFPGTGKTEVVKQIAKETGREIMMVDISEAKTMWFGESEKLVKKIFTGYKDLAEKSKRLPILLFNEADALISKRKNVNSGNTAQTENAIQNILLEEIENFAGILMATTNLTDNIDKAFERRFLFKIHFDKPAKEIQAKIWQLKLPFLTAEEVLLLAGQFDFSGGQIDNIARKCEVQEVVYGNALCLDDVIKFCKTEKLSSSLQSVGFKK